MLIVANYVPIIHVLLVFPKAGLVSPECPEQLLIALEPEAASIYCRKLRLHQVIDLSLQPVMNGLDLDGPRPFDSGFRQGSEGWDGEGKCIPTVQWWFWFTLRQSWKRLWVCCTGGFGVLLQTVFECVKRGVQRVKMWLTCVLASSAGSFMRLLPGFFVTQPPIGTSIALIFSSLLP